jgi:hypothetical protein
VTTRTAGSDARGHLLEEIAALLHRGMGVDVEMRVKLPACHDPSRLREIDVLLSSQVAGYPVRFAIECKNERKRTTTGQIDSLLSKLQDVGIPVQAGIYISAAGYTKDAIRRAKKEGLRLLELHGLTSDRLAAAVDDALHSLVFLLPEVRMVTRFDDVDPEGARLYSVPPGLPRISIDAIPEQVPGFAVILDLLWRLWMKGGFPDTVGDHHCFFDLPPEFPFWKGDVIRHGTMIVSLHVSAVVFSAAGIARHFQLLDAETKLLERFHLDARFTSGPQLVPAKLFGTEEDLQKHLAAGPGVRLVARIRVPRIVQQSFYWPISPQAAERFRRLRAEGKPITFESVEGFDLGRAWEYFESQSVESQPDSSPAHSSAASAPKER